MKTIGMIGGMSWESTAIYYRIINREVQKRLGGVHSAKALLYSFDFTEMAKLQADGKWDEADGRMATAAVTLEKAGADFLIICCNTMHRSTPVMERTVDIPLLHIAEPLGTAMAEAGVSNPALLGSRFTMESDAIIRGRLKQRFGLSVHAPAGADAEFVDRVIFEEFVRGIFSDSTRKTYASIIARLVAHGADGLIMGCTEIPLLLRTEDCAVPTFDTLTLHALAAVDYALA
ncbi:MAG: amino acid racemase [Rhizomicrobium sp.]